MILWIYTEASKSIAPKDYAGLLQEKDGIITGVILLPDTEVFEQNTVVKLFMMQHVKTEDFGPQSSRFKP